MTTSHTKALKAVGCKGAGDPSTEQLAAINGYALKELTADEVYVRTMYLAHNAIDRDKEVFDDALLRDFAKTLPGKGLFIKHPRSYDGDSGPGEGLFFEAKLLEMSFEEARAKLKEPTLMWAPSEEKALILEASFYAVRTEENKTLLAKIDAGIAGHVSIGFSASEYTPIKDDANNRIASRWHAPGSADEGSIVWLGAQNGARIHKNASPNNPANEDTDMDWEKKAKDLETELDTTKSALTTAQNDAQGHKTKAANFDAVCKALGGDELTVDEITTLAQDGKSYRDDLVGDLVTLKRQKGLVGDTEDAETEAKAFYKSMPLTMIKNELDGHKKSMPAGAQIVGGDPSTSGAEGEGGKGLRDKSVTQKALGTSSTKAA